MRKYQSIAPEQSQLARTKHRESEKTHI